MEVFFGYFFCTSTMLDVTKDMFFLQLLYIFFAIGLGAPIIYSENPYLAINFST